MPSLRIAILTLRVDEFRPTYFMYQISEAWREAGYEVQLVQGPDQPAEADLVVLHTDITTVPGEYLSAVRCYPASLNGHVADISKRLISENLVLGPKGHDGPVIVKTNRNAGGWQEAYIAHLGLLPASYKFATSDYEIYQTAEAVPEPVWTDPDLVVERYLPEQSDGYYCVRAWVFLGDRETSWISYSTHPIVKQGNIERRETLGSVPEELRARREELAFEFGRFDYVEVDGRAVLLDANRTPTLGTLPRETFIPRLRGLADGVRGFLP